MNKESNFIEKPANILFEKYEIRLRTEFYEHFEFLSRDMGISKDETIYTMRETLETSIWDYFQNRDSFEERFEEG